MPKAKTSSKRSRAGASRKRESRRDERSAQPRPFWSGTLSFGLVSVPVALYAATHAAHLGLRRLAPDGTPLSRRFFCPEHERALEPDEIVRGYAYAPGRYVTLTDEELEALEPRKSRELDLQRFVAVDALDPSYFERAYHLLPAGDSTKAYQLLATVMERTQRAGLGTFVLRAREHVVAILASAGVLSAQTMRFPEQVRSDDSIPGGRRKPAPDAKRVTRYASWLSKHFEAEIDLAELRDPRNDALRKLASTKAKRNQDVVEVGDTSGAEPGQPVQTVDLMGLLKRSLKAS